MQKTIYLIFALMLVACTQQRQQGSTTTAHVALIGGTVKTSQLSLRLLPSSTSTTVTIQELTNYPFVLPAKIHKWEYRLVMLTSTTVTRETPYKITLSELPRNEVFITYKRKTATTEKRLLEVYSFDGTNFEIIGRSFTDSVNDTPLFATQIGKKLQKGLIVFASSFTQTEFKNACVKFGGHFNGAYCGP
jgi:hypothetical protein